MRLGKKEYRFDERTLRMVRYMDTTLKPPLNFSFDKGRRPFPLRMWGNDAFGDCVSATQMNALLRIERVETRHTLHSTDEDVIRTYQTLSGCRAPGDENDNGLVMLDAFRFWRNDGWTIGKANEKQYKISAFGELEPSDANQLRLGCYLLHGLHFGFALPRSARSQTAQGYWDVVEGPDARPGSWGGHAVYSPMYTADGFIVKSWGRDIEVSNRFIERYCDEVWVVVDDVDRWRKHTSIDVEALEKRLDEIGAIRH
jgi:hypothetical protein